ncbi:hypothetical protein GZH47_09725 [Paenibacillus rhizovicinus]|uniref:Uncharacterized protein n=1 Tax=Paenibacillus rhizovicinus TaxID=2704463 RepID=A0A6C0NYT9_9BACL|nr:hypothetical protein [Paenibacillus rhizovicinus]QHW31106.1 hypothetical protein GZH47_09725 [Paenibacillus rhizovicinus]
MKQEITFTSVVLEGNSKSSKIKLFYNDETEENYAECYLNIDLPNKKVEWFEKDPEYREALLRALSA